MSFVPKSHHTSRTVQPTCGTGDAGPTARGSILTVPRSMTFHETEFAPAKTATTTSAIARKEPPLMPSPAVSIGRTSDNDLDDPRGRTRLRRIKYDCQL